MYISAAPKDAAPLAKAKGFHGTPTPQQRQPFEDPLEARGKQGKQVCPSASLGTSRTPGKDPLAALSDAGFRAGAVSRRNSRRGMFRAKAQRDSRWDAGFSFFGGGQGL